MIDPVQMAALHAAAFAKERPWSRDEFAALLAQDTVFAIGDARAFALIRVVADEAELLTLATDPAHRRQGLARALMAHWHDAAARNGARRALLEVAADNRAARRLYEACGYSECARRPGYYTARSGPPVDALILDRALP